MAYRYNGFVINLPNLVGSATIAKKQPFTTNEEDDDDDDDEGYDDCAR